jgi:hypothetical protein
LYQCSPSDLLGYSLGGILKVSIVSRDLEEYSNGEWVDLQFGGAGEARLRLALRRARKKME